MKKYVIMIQSLSNMGGAQMYIRSKILYLREHGWAATVVAGRAENVVIPELREFRVSIPELIFSNYFFTLKTQRCVLDKLKEIILDKNYQEVYIESASIEVSTWAELVAKEIGARHLIFLLQEQNHVNNKLLKDFFVFKYKRHEIAGISNKSLVAMFRDFYPLEETESYTLPAHCTNVEADVECELLKEIDRSQYNYVVGAMSRMDKPFVLHAVEDFCNYVSAHPDKRFLFLWIGNAPSGSLMPERIKKMVEMLSNVELLITGYMLPVPTKLLEFCDVFISSSGSSRPCMRSGVPTITYDAIDYKPIGILGRTTNNALFRDKDEKPQDLSTLLYAILEKKEYPKLQANYRSGIPDFKIHMEFLEEMDQTKDYFDIDRIHLETLSEKKVAIGLRLLGPKGYLKLHSIKER